MVSTVIGHGSFVLKIGDTTRVLWYFVKTDGFKFYDQKIYDHKPNIQPQSLFELLPELASGQYFNTISTQGKLSLVSLPASPKDAFYQMELVTSANAIKLHIKESGKFASRSTTFFKDLDVTFTESRAGGNLQVEGKVNLCLLGRSDLDIELNPKLMPDDGRLVFQLVSQPNSFEISQLGRLTIDMLEVGRNDNLRDGLQALYTFSEPTGDVFLDSSATEMAIDLKSSSPIERKSGELGISICNSTVLQSQQSVNKIVKACKGSNAITISAWVKPQISVKQDKEQLPARIVSLSENRTRCNFMLGQTLLIRKKHITDIEENRYIVRLRRGWNICGDGKPALFSKPRLWPTETLEHVVFTRDSSKTSPGKIYINGKDQTQTEEDFNPGNYKDYDRCNYTTDTEKLSGDFSKWSSDKYSLLLGNEKEENYPWRGEIHQVAIYSRALSQGEIFYSYFPAIKLEATLRLNRVPTPFLDVPFSVTIDLDKDELNAKLTDRNALEVAPFLHFNQVNFNDFKLKQSTSESSEEVLNILGKTTATLWGNLLTFEVNLTSNEFTLSLSGQQKTLTLNDVDPLSSLGNMLLKQLTIRADRRANLPTWDLQTDGQVTFATIPPPLQGKFPVQLFLDNGKLWFSVSPIVPLKLVEHLSFDRANLRFVRDDSGWQVEPDLRGDREGISILLFGESRPLTAELKQNFKSLTLAWKRPGTAFTSTPPGKLNLADFSLTSDQSDQDPEDSLWQVFMSGQIPLVVPEKGTKAGVLEFNTEYGKILGNSPGAQQQTRLEGKSRLQNLDDLIFEGDLGLRDNSILLNGHFTLFPHWSLLQVYGDSLITIDPDGQVQFESPVQVTLPDFVLLDSKLVLTNGWLALSGAWLGKEVTFTALHRADQSIWEGPVQFDLPFSLTLGPLYDFQSSIKLADQIQVCQTLDCRQIMKAPLVIELSSAGFLARVKSEFTWQDKTKTNHDLEVAEFQLFTPPATRNTLLGQILQQVKAQSDELFAPKFKPANGYFFAVSDSKPLVYFGDYNSSAVKEQEIILPQLFTGANEVGENDFSIKANNGAAIFTLKESEDKSFFTLTILPQGITPTDLDQLRKKYNAFLNQLDDKSNLISGALTLVKACMAERMPSLLDEVLYYYYGFNPSERMVDLQAGMRLRVEYQNYQFVHPSDKTAETGFVSSGIAYYSLQFDAEGNYLSFDPFLSALPVALESPNQGVSGLIDLLRPGYGKSFYRLIYPDEFLATSGRIGAERAAILIGANDFNTLNQASNYYQKPSAAQRKAPDNIAVIYFRGRATVVPEIAIFVQEQPEYVPVGTTLRQLQQRYGNVALRGRMQRLVHEGVNNTPDYRFVNLGNDLAALDLPLVQGDRVYF